MAKKPTKRAAPETEPVETIYIEPPMQPVQTTDDGWVPATVGGLTLQDLSIKHAPAPVEEDSIVPLIPQLLDQANRAIGNISTAIENTLSAMPEQAPTDDGWVPDLWANFEVSTVEHSPHTITLKSFDHTPYRVQLELPLAMLMALIDPYHPNADPDAAVLFGLIDRKTLKPTRIGALVLSGTDQTSIRHKMRWAR